MQTGCSCKKYNFQIYIFSGQQFSPNNAIKDYTIRFKGEGVTLDATRARIENAAARNYEEYANGNETKSDYATVMTTLRQDYFVSKKERHFALRFQEFGCDAF